MKIACASDIHGKFKRRYPAGDTLIIAGDIMKNYSRDKRRDAFIQLQNFYENLCPILVGLKREKIFSEIILIAGNHDRVFEFHQGECAEYLKKIGIHYLSDSGVEINGIKFWGSPWSPWFFGDHWSFNLSGRYPEEHAKEIWGKIPTDTDVLITHGPPYGILDKVPQYMTPKGVLSDSHVGCPVLVEEVKRVRPILHVFGHIHEGHGQIRQDDTIFVNASIHDGDFQPTNQIQVVKL